MKTLKILKKLAKSEYVPRWLSKFANKLKDERANELADELANQPVTHEEFIKSNISTGRAVKELKDQIGNINEKIKPIPEVDKVKIEKEISRIDGTIVQILPAVKEVADVSESSMKDIDELSKNKVSNDTFNTRIDQMKKEIADESKKKDGRIEDLCSNIKLLVEANKLRDERIDNLEVLINKLEERQDVFKKEIDDRINLLEAEAKRQLLDLDSKIAEINKKADELAISKEIRDKLQEITSEIEKAKVTYGILSDEVCVMKDEHAEDLKRKTREENMQMQLNHIEASLELKGASKEFIQSIKRMGDVGSIFGTISILKERIERVQKDIEPEIKRFNH